MTKLSKISIFNITNPEQAVLYNLKQILQLD